MWTSNTVEYLTEVKLTLLELAKQGQNGIQFKKLNKLSIKLLAHLYVHACQGDRSEK